MDQKKIIVLVIAGVGAILLLSSFGGTKSKPVEVRGGASAGSSVMGDPLKFLKKEDGSIDWNKVFMFSPAGPFLLLKKWNDAGEATRRDNLLNEAYSRNWFKTGAGLEGQGWRQFVDGTMPVRLWPALLADANRYLAHVNNPATWSDGTKERVINRYRSVAQQIVNTVKEAIETTSNI